MKYVIKKSDVRTYVTSTLKGTDPDRRLVNNEIKVSSGREPLVRVYSKYDIPQGTGDYRLAYKEDDEWTIYDGIHFSSVRDAEKFIDMMHLFFIEVAIVQLYPEDKVWMGLDRDDPFDFDEDTGEL